MASLSDFAGDSTGVRVNERPPYLQEVGSYLFEVNRCVAGEKRAGGLYFVAELKVIESDQPKYPEGSKVSFFIDFAKNPDMKKEELYKFVMQGFNEDLPTTAKMLKESLITGDRQLLAGEKVRCIVELGKPSKKDGKRWPQKRWVAVAKPTAKVA